MKKTLALLLMMMLCAGLVLTACGGGASSAAPASTAPASAAPAPAAEEEDVVDEEEDVVDEEEDVADEEDDVNAQILAEADAMASLFSDAYYGLSTDGDEVVMLMGPDTAALAFVNGDLSASFVGEYTVSEPQMTIVDQNNGLQITFTVEEDEDGYWLDIGDVGDVYVEPMELDAGILAMLGISYGTEAIV